MTRSFGHRLFKVKEHVDRLYRSLKYLRIDPGFGPEKMCELTEELFERNRHLLGPDDDYWVGQRISRGVKEVPGDNLDHHGPNIVLECAPLPLVQRAKLFKEGIRVVVPSHRRVPPDSLTPRAKTHNYLNLDRRRTRRCSRSTPRPGRCSSTSTATSARAWARTSSR